MNHLELLKNMGIRYVAYRIWYEFKRRSGILKRAFPKHYSCQVAVPYETWKKEAPPFFFSSRDNICRFPLTDALQNKLCEDVKKIFSGTIQFFNGEWIDIGTSYNWHSNPVSGFTYNANSHWTTINDFDTRQGDIKYVWEKSRFCYLYTILRYDKQTDSDSSAFVFREIISWIAANPLNCGPHYKCSQEISIRILTWIFTLYFYSNSVHLAAPVESLHASQSIPKHLHGNTTFDLIVNSIYGQVKHIEKNFNFSRYTVRNNHAITEALALFTIGTLFPWFTEAQRWKMSGKQNLINEAFYQIYDDGGYLQHSFNYHRVVLQLYTWAFALARNCNEQFPKELHDRLARSLDFVYQHQDAETGQVPNYGSNDGSIFFPLNSCYFGDYRPALNTLHYLLKGSPLYSTGLWNEDIHWFTPSALSKKVLPANIPLDRTTRAFCNSGFFILRYDNRFAAIRCCSFRDRPAHADNLHIDLWYRGHNIMTDSGTYLYNASTDMQQYFFGTRSHNSVMIDNFDQMEKGPRFIWYKWSRALSATISEHDDFFEFCGVIEAFRQVAKGIIHSRTVRLYKNDIRWEITDEIDGWKGVSHQIWHPSPVFNELGLSISSVDAGNQSILPKFTNGWYSPTYGAKEVSQVVTFSTAQHLYKTVVQLKMQ